MKLNESKGCHLELSEIDAAADPVMQEAGVRRPSAGNVGLFLGPGRRYFIQWMENDDGDIATLRTFEIDKCDAAHLLVRFWIPEPFVDLFGSTTRLLHMRRAVETFKGLDLEAPQGQVRRALDVVTKWLEDETQEFGGEPVPQFRIVREGRTRRSRTPRGMKKRGN